MSQNLGNSNWNKTSADKKNQIQPFDFYSKSDTTKPRSFRLYKRKKKQQYDKLENQSSIESSFNFNLTQKSINLNQSNQNGRNVQLAEIETAIKNEFKNSKQAFKTAINFNASGSIEFGPFPMREDKQPQSDYMSILDSHTNNYEITQNDQDKNQTNKESPEKKKIIEDIIYKSNQFLLTNNLPQGVFPKKTKPGDFFNVHELVSYQGKVRLNQYPSFLIEPKQLEKRLNYNELRDARLNEIVNQKKNDVRGYNKRTFIQEILEKNAEILEVKEKDDLEKLEMYQDRLPLLDCRKGFVKLWIIFRILCEEIIYSPMFDNTATIVILANSMIMIISSSGTTPDWTYYTDRIFQAFYTSEVILKMVGQGLFFSEKPYFKDPWNLLDVLVVSTGFVDFAVKDASAIQLEVGPEQEPPSSSSQSLKVLRVARPLRTVNKIQGLKILMNSLITALPMLGDALLFLMIIFVGFAIMGQQLWTGVLKYHCVSLQFGKPLVDESDAISGGGNLCSSDQDCGGGYYCAKTNYSPNYNAENFDNIFWAFLNVFDIISLEGWSYTQVDVQSTMSVVAFIYFWIVVLIGTFLCINLTLAVINAKFTEANNDFKREEQAKKEAEAQKFSLIVASDEDNKKKERQFSILQYITARIYAKKMRAFLRKRQEEKNILEREIQKYRNCNLAVESIKKDLSDYLRDSALDKIQKNSENKSENIPFPSIGQDQQNNQQLLTKIVLQEKYTLNEQIPEEDSEQGEDQNENDLLNTEVKQLVKQEKIRMQNAGISTKEVELPKNVDFRNLDNKLDKIRFETTRNLNNFEENFGINNINMKGMLGQSKPKKYVDQNLLGEDKKKVFARLAEEFDFDKVFPKEDQQNLITRNGKILQTNQSNSFELSFNEQNYSYNEEIDDASNKKRQKLKTQLQLDFFPQLINKNNKSELVSDDSEFDLAVMQADYEPQENDDYCDEEDFMPIGSGLNTGNLKKDVSKTFKKMLIQNFKRQFNQKGDNESTNYEGSNGKELKSDSDSTNIPNIEEKFIKKNYNSAFTKYYKEDQQQHNTKKLEKDALKYIEQLEEQEKQNGGKEFVSSVRPYDPYSDLDLAEKKVVLSEKKIYKGASEHDIFEIKHANLDFSNFLEQNKYIKIPKHLQFQEDPDFQAKQTIQHQFKPYQLKKQYNPNPLSSEEEVEKDDQLFEEKLCFLEQPGSTIRKIIYNKDLQQLNLQQKVIRSDIIITSTIGINLIPKDQAGKKFSNRVLMNEDQVKIYIDEREKFKASVTEINNKMKIHREKDYQYRYPLYRDSIFNGRFKSTTIKEYQQQIKILNTNSIKDYQKTPEALKLENLKFNQNQRAAKKRAFPQNQLDTMKVLLKGKFHKDFRHSDEEEDLKDEKAPVQFQKKSRLEVHQFGLHDIFIQAYNKQNPDQDFIPEEIRQEFRLPNSLGFFEVNNFQIRQTDFDIKKPKYTWSGQDVLADKLDYEKSITIVEDLSDFRVWPDGFNGVKKRIQHILRVKVRHSYFDNLMTLCVLINTCTLCMDRYNQDPQVESTINQINQILTGIFIYEFFSKHLGIGVIKYWQDRMNYIDGLVVIFSLIEYVLLAFSNSRNLGSLKVLRSLRVFRIARLLKSFKSMQQIISVLARSIDQILYISGLLILFVLIFTLLQNTIFQQSMAGPNGTPFMNFTNFQNSLACTFQVLTVENWNNLYFGLLAPGWSIGHEFVICIILMFWLFLGNWILLNLFLAILLDSFVTEEEDDEAAVARQKALELKKEKKLMIKKQRILRNNKNRIFLNEIMKEGQVKKVLNTDEQILEKNQPSEDEDINELDEEQIIIMLKQEGILEKTQEDINKEELFIGNKCNHSIYLFAKDDQIRQSIYKILKSSRFEYFIVFIICLSSLKLFMDTFDEHFSEQVKLISTNIDLVINSIFIMECAMKIIAYGYTMDQGSYLRDIWNMLDHFIVLISIVDMTLTGSNISQLKILRLLRVLRLLRMVSRNEDMKKMLISLSDAILPVMSVLMIFSVVILIFAILGVSFYKGTQFYCSINKYTFHTQLQCEQGGGLWERARENFDNVWEGWLTLFCVTSLENWPASYQQFAEYSGVDLGPTQNYWFPSLLFYMVYIFATNFFLLNLFTGVLFMKYQEASKKDLKGFSQKDLDWIDIQKMIVDTNPTYTKTNVPRSGWRKDLHSFVISWQFDVFIMAIIVLNVMQMAASIENASPQYQSFLDQITNFFNAVFYLEWVLKAIAFYPTYLKNNWNKFDFFIVAATLLDYSIFSNPALGITSLSWTAQITKIIRLFRVTRLLKLMVQLNGLAAIIETITFSISPLFNVFGLLMIVLAVFSVMCCSFFSRGYAPIILSDSKNFDNFLQAMLLNMALATGEDWNNVMYDTAQIGPNSFSILSQLFWIIFVIVFANVMLNLFILVIIQQFEKYYLNSDSKMATFKVDLQNFLTVWEIFTQEKYHCFKIKEDQLVNFFIKLGEQGDAKSTLGFPMKDIEKHQNKEQQIEKHKNEVMKHIMKMGIKSDNGFISFNEMLYRCIKRRYGNWKISKRMQIFELNTQFKVFLNALASKGQLRFLDNDFITSKLIKKINDVNPFLQQMNFKISFKAWRKQAQKLILKKEKENFDQSWSDVETSRIQDQIEVKFHECKIEIEQFYQITSDEDDEIELSQLKKHIPANILKQQLRRLQTLSFGAPQLIQPSKKNFLKTFQHKFKKNLQNQLREAILKNKEKIEQNYNKNGTQVESNKQNTIINMLSQYRINVLKQKQMEDDD